MIHIDVGRNENKTEISGAMTDISFLLIIFFIVTAVFFADKGLFLILPKKGRKPVQLNPKDVVEVSIGRDALFLNGRKVVNMDYFRAVVKERLEINMNTVVVLNVLRGVKYQRVLSVIEEAKKGGASEFSIISLSRKSVPVKVERREH